MPQITIAGKAFDIADRYSEGDTLTANEAAALNQVRRENIRNNLATQVKDHKGTDEELASIFSDYSSAYEFGQRTSGGSRDPIETEAMNIARETIKATLRRNGKSLSDYSAAQFTAAARNQVDTNPIYREQAKKRLEELASVSTGTDDLLAGLGEPQPKTETSTEAETAPATGRKTKGSAAAE